ncbi:MAG TPA: hypothetical protein VNF07_00905 [Acidimicrobiales bacterium]|nr:hypothetical protein [Acidimicrobiales bacterium]
MSGEEDALARSAIAGKFGLLPGVLVPLFHRLARYTTLHYELTAATPEGT